jgi:hypothetical protein
MNDVYRKMGRNCFRLVFEDSKLKKKLRRTKKQIFKELKELGFKGSYRTLYYFIYGGIAIMRNLIRATNY